MCAQPSCSRYTRSGLAAPTTAHVRSVKRWWRQSSGDVGHGCTTHTPGGSASSGVRSWRPSKSETGWRASERRYALLRDPHRRRAVRADVLPREGVGELVLAEEDALELADVAVRGISSGVDEKLHARRLQRATHRWYERASATGVPSVSCSSPSSELTIRVRVQPRVEEEQARRPLAPEHVDAVERAGCSVPARRAVGRLPLEQQRVGRVEVRRVEVCGACSGVSSRSPSSRISGASCARWAETRATRGAPLLGRRNHVALGPALAVAARTPEGGGVGASDAANRCCSRRIQKSRRFKSSGTSDAARTTRWCTHVSRSSAFADFAIPYKNCESHTAAQLAISKSYPVQ